MKAVSVQPFCIRLAQSHYDYDSVQETQYPTIFQKKI